jgi:AraC-like DNA-binding protein
MAKYNICEIKEKKAAYRSLVSPAVMDRMQEQILKIIVFDKKYLDKNYSAQDLANEIGTNTRYISAVVNVRFHMNFTSFVNSYRINDAKSILVDKRYQDLNIEEVSDMVGFSNRQSFYAAFYRFTGITPRQWRIDNLRQHPSMVAKNKKKK